MNRFHIYEAIGRGKCSTVYKGRKKKTIEYYAIKSVDKSQKRKVLHEVKILHSLDHSNVLKFYSWYETSAHLWLVLEYCVGGDLRTLLQQDSQLPEDSVQDFALDLVTALQYLHSKGIIYCDLKPSNILLDENGLLKLCDFGLAKKLSDISKTHSSSTEAKCGTPCYMAPELFEDAGVHSYASDFWALGCVLYECYAGKPPFVGKEFTQLVKSIVSDPTPPLPGNPSRHFANLVNSLLVKDPAERIQWSDLCGHAFWKSKLPLMSLPPQPAFDCMIEFYARPCLLEHNGDRSLQNKTPTEGRERDARVTPRKDENSQSGLRGELLFYIATQNDQSKDNNPSKSPAKDNNKSVPGWQGRDDFQITLLQVLESIVEESPLILANPQIFVGEILPSLATLYKGNKDGHVRFLCLKILFHVMVIFLNELSQDDKLSKALNSIANVHFLPLYPTLVEDEDPIPIFSQKLLVMLIDFNFIKISDILHVKTVSQCFGFLLGDLSSANVSNVKLCLAMASAPEMESKLLSQLKVVRRISNLLEFVCAKDMEDFLEPTLGLCRAFLLRSLTGEQGSAFRTQPSLLTAAGGFSSGGSVDGIRDVMDFGSNVGLWLELSCNSSTEPNVAELASECVVLLLKAAPREATTGFLTNLPKVSTILEPWRRGVPRLILLRTLHALCYACRQYLSHAMILSMSVAEVSRVQGIVMEIKGSAGGDLSDAASLVGLELQRLPRHL
ncbi:unnamed protein product [Linum tenue]|uniref:non-specific serine/threonine protein kinase n=1 Tax=Linum tenue TaxID=586396 RepID=A0AAV0S5G9_9ROSI|nr:unnamed protein product [Linum tenue]